MVNIFVSIERNIILIYVYIFLSDLQWIYKWRKISKNNSGKSISKIMKNLFIDSIVYLLYSICILCISNLFIKIYRCLKQNYS